MSCPTCGHVMAQLFDMMNDHSEQVKVEHCARCGTFRRQVGNFTEIDVPKLVERCREFARRHVTNDSLRGLWRHLGIEQAIDLPENRQ